MEIFAESTSSCRSDSCSLNDSAIGWFTRHSNAQSCSKVEDPVWKRKLSDNL